MDAALATARSILESPPAGASPIVEALFRAEAAVPLAEAVRHAGREALNALIAVGLARERAGSIEGTARLTRFGGQLIASDRMGFRHHPEFVLGPGPATTNLAGVVRPLPRGRVLDLGCGPGSLALWLASTGAEAIGIDIARRALAFADFNRRLNAQPGVTVRIGDFLTAPPDPTLDGRFDACVANPPFVLAPPAERQLVYRDGPLPGDHTTRVTIERVMRTLAPGGRGYVVGTWADDGKARWDARPRGWLRRFEGRSLVTRIASVTPDDYVRSWTRDLHEPARAAAVDAWLPWLREQGIARITTGLVAVARPRRRSWRRGVVEALETARPGWRAVDAILEGC